MTMRRGLRSAAVMGMLAALMTGPATAAVDGLQWAEFQATPNGATLAAVAGVSPSDVWAVGLKHGGPCQYQTLAERWNGSAWVVVATPNVPALNSVLNAVDARTPSDVWAVGESACPGRRPGRPLVERWDGVSWSMVPAPSPPGDSVLFAVAAVAADDVWAVGSTVSHGLELPLVERWDGTRWRIVRAPAVRGGLHAVSAAGPQDVWAAGDLTSPGAAVPLLAHWDGRAWTAVPGAAAGPGSFLTGLAASSPTDVWAVGSARPTGGTLRPLVERWDGRRWSRAPVPDVGSFSGLNAVDTDPAGGTWAAGFSVNVVRSRAVILRLTRSGWVEVPPPDTGEAFGLAALPGPELWTLDGPAMFHGSAG